MSKHDIARSALEGGRNGYSKNKRRQSHRDERALTRQWLARAAVGEDDYLAYPERPYAEIEFTDKIRPAEGWMKKQAKRGALWNDVHAALVNMFDSRTTAGRHILFDHMLRGVNRFDEKPAQWYSGRFAYEIDEKGVLVKQTERTTVRRRVKLREEPVNVVDVGSWLGDRRVKLVGGVPYWLEGAHYLRRNCDEGGWCPRLHVEKGRRAVHVDAMERRMSGYNLAVRWVVEREHVVPDGCFRQGRALDERDLKQWKRWPWKVREEILK